MGTVIAVIVTLAFEMWATAAAIDALRHFPKIAVVISIPLFIVTGISSLVGFWLVADRINFRRLGYQVKWIKENDWEYEERSSTSEKRTLTYVREVQGEGYPAPCTIRILDVEDWENSVPKWARGRRSEIIARILDCHGVTNDSKNSD